MIDTASKLPATSTRLGWCRDDVRVRRGWVGGSERFAVWEDSHSMFEVADIVAEVIDAGAVDGPVML